MQSPPPAVSGQLPRVLGPWMATAVVIGTVIGSGVFKKPHEVSKELSNFGLIMLAWVLLGVLCLLGSLILAEVAIIHPRAGGNYVFLREGYGRWAGFLWGWVEFWIIRSGSIAALATVFTESFHDILRYLNGSEPGHEILSFWVRQGISVTVIALLALVNARGTVLGAGLQVVITSVKVVSLVGIALLPFIFLAFVDDSKVRFDRLSSPNPIWPDDWSAVDWTAFGSALVGVFWAYHGWMNIVPVAEEVKEPNRNIPLSLIVGTLTIIALYLSVNLAYHLVVPLEVMKKECAETPVATRFSWELLGSTGTLLASLALLTSVFGSLNGNLLVGPRLLFAMGQDGLAPRVLSRLHVKFGTPALAVAVMTCWSILLVLGMAILVNLQVLGESIFTNLTDYAIFGALSFETMAVASIFMCRRQYPVATVSLPYRCWGYPWIPIFYVAVMAVILGNMFWTKRDISLIATAFTAVGAIVYFVMFGGTAAGPVDTPGPREEIRAGEPPFYPEK